jgi:hypothetical protein
MIEWTKAYLKKIIPLACTRPFQTLHEITFWHLVLQSQFQRITSTKMHISQTPQLQVWTREWHWKLVVLCHNPSLGLATKVKVCKSVGQKRDPGVWENVRMNIHTPKWTPMLGIGIPMNSRIFREQLQGSKPISLKKSLYHWKDIETKMSEMGSHDPFGHLKHKLWSKERSGVKLTIWLPTTKSWELTQCPCMLVACNTPLEISRRGL